MALYLYQDLIAEASTLMNDPSNLRYAQADLLTYLNEGVRETLAFRTELAFDSYGTAVTDGTLTSAFPLPPEFRRALVAYVIGRAETKDADYAVGGRAAAQAALADALVERV
jgi:hypothetical protein